MRHRRHTTLASARPRTLRASAAMPCVAAALVAVLTGAAPGPDAHGAGPREHAAVSAVSAEGGTEAKSPRVRGTSRGAAARVRPSPAATDATGVTEVTDAREARDARDGPGARAAHGDRGPHADPGHGHHDGPRYDGPQHDAPDSAPDPAGDPATGRAPGTDSGYGSDSYGDGSGLFGTQDLYEQVQPEPAHPGPESAPSDGGTPTTAATGEVSPVLPLGAGLTLIGLGLALIAVRLRHT
ncbi:hypothetical protein HCC61_25815 [Streptomyces sp. HNM0575]|uniref:hypothetical protein n=1 Tax=Streptomyces sp. HNM0575 TaxID=2716338 RepID=UPI00145D3C6F|nr:hypothetical protein [Streptomyces sp. HNM0575]NLU76027.1 hypothetical protein [Streptomyces sp. HNM0575]